MENKIKAIKFDMGDLPVDNPDELDYIQPEKFPGQFMVTRKGHNRSLEVLLIDAVSGDRSAQVFNLSHSFAYWKPEIKNGALVDEIVYIDRKKLKMNVHNWLIASDEYYYGKDELYGKLPDVGKRYKTRLMPLDLNHFEFYSMDKERNIHSIEIDLKYIQSKDLTKFTALYDNNTLVQLDTNGDYSLKYLKQSFRHIFPGISLSLGDTKKKGNLLQEQDFTLYIDTNIPVKVYAKTSKEKI